LDTGTFNILVVDDDPGLQNLYRDILKSVPPTAATSGGAKSSDRGEPPGFKVVCRSQAHEAVATVQESMADGDPFSAIFLDVNLPPGPSGVWAADQILKIDFFILVFVFLRKKYI